MKRWLCAHTYTSPSSVATAVVSLRHATSAGLHKILHQLSAASEIRKYNQMAIDRSTGVVKNVGLPAFTKVNRLENWGGLLVSGRG